jgi:hypothetical protein
MSRVRRSESDKRSATLKIAEQGGPATGRTIATGSMNNVTAVAKHVAEMVRRVS